MKQIKLKYIVLLIFFFGSCNILKNSNEHKPEIGLFDKIEKNQLEYSVLKIKYNGHFHSNTTNDFDFSGTILIYKDSLIKANVSYLLGLPVAFVKISKDSIKIKSSFFDNSKEALANTDKFIGAKFNYKQLEALLTGEVFLYPDSNKALNYKATQTDTCITFKFAQKDNNSGLTDIMHEIRINKNLKITSQTIWDFTNFRDFELYAKYSNFKLLNNKLFPYNIDITTVKNDTMSVTLNYKSVKIIK